MKNDNPQLLPSGPYLVAFGRAGRESAYTLPPPLQDIQRLLRAFRDEARARGYVTGFPHYHHGKVGAADLLRPVPRAVVRDIVGRLAVRFQRAVILSGRAAPSGEDIAALNRDIILGVMQRDSIAVGLP